MTVNCFASAARTLATARNEDSGKPVARNTRLFWRGPDAIAVRLHWTDVVTYHRDGRIVLNSGGYRTPTTKDRINAFSPAWVSQSKWVWYMADGSRYFDGMEV